MEKILRNPEYLKQQKKKYSFYTFLTLVIMLADYSFGLWLTATPKNIFTILAVFLILGVAQLGVRLIVYLPYGDPSKRWIEQFKEIPAPYVLWNSALLTNGKNNVFFDGILVGNSKMYCFAQKKPINIEKTENVILYLLERRGINIDVNFIYGNKDINVFIPTLREEATIDLEQQKECLEVLRLHSL